MLAVEWPVVRATLGCGAVEEMGDVDVATRLSELKARVPAMQARVGRRVWQLLTTSPDPPAPQPLASRAYHKMREIRLSCALPSATRSVHLCEAPGGFVQATAEDAAPGWEWVALSRHDGPAPALSLLPMHCGRFLEADVRDAHDLIPAHTADLVTCDGANEMDHARIEAEHLPLLLAQTAVALHALGEGGVLVIKFFEGLTDDTEWWIACVTTRFARVSIIKPIGSRASNSERYLVARGFEGDASPLPARGTLSAAWRRDTRRVLHRFASDQCDALARAMTRAMARSASV